MSVTSVSSGEIFTVRTYKSYAGYSWANTYEVRAVNDLADAYSSMEDMSNRFTALEAGLHLSGITIDRIVVSTYVPDGEPYDPSSFVVFPKSFPAVGPTPADVLPLELCIYVRRQVSSGRFGKLFYRGCFTEDGLSSTAFRPLITTTQRVALQGLFSAWLTAGGPGPDWQLVLARGRPTPTDVRVVTTLIVETRVVIKQLRNRYFDIP